MNARKQACAVLTTAALLLSLGACSTKPETTPEPQSETLSGTAQGYGGEVRVELTRTDGVINACTITAEGETPTVGGAALDDLQKQVVAANGYDIDGVSGATVTSRAVMSATASALGETYVPPTPAPIETAPAAEIVPIEGGLQIGMALGAAHGDQCFTQVFAVVKDDVIVAANIDEFQFIDNSPTAPQLPNGDDEFGQGYAEGQMLVTKRSIAEGYSKLMAAHGGATIPIDQNWDAIQSFVVGKTIDELKTLSGDSKAVDAVSGATLTDTAGYLGVIVQAAENAQATQGVEFSGDSSNLELKVGYGAAHGSMALTVAAALTDGNRIVLCYVDEYQFVDSSTGAQGVPSSDGEFGQNCAEGQTLTTKRTIAEGYSQLMAAHGGATISIDQNWNAIQNHVNGMTIADAKSLSGQSNAADAVSGATLTDTAGYVAVIVEAAES